MLLELFGQFFHDKSAWELLAVACALAYLVLAIRQSVWCWPAAFVSTLIYTGLFWHVSLLMESALNVYYMAMAIYGWWAWTRHSGAANAASPKVILWPWQFHVLGILAVLALSYGTGTLLEQNTQAAWPFLDSFTTWASVLTTYLVAKKVLENWLYWMVINSISIFLYIDRGLYPTVLLLSVYLLMSVYGFYAWKKSMQGRESEKEQGAEEFA